MEIRTGSVVCKTDESGDWRVGREIHRHDYDGGDALWRLDPLRWVERDQQWVIDQQSDAECHLTWSQLVDMVARVVRQ